MEPHTNQQLLVRLNHRDLAFCHYGGGTDVHQEECENTGRSRRDGRHVRCSQCATATSEQRRMDQLPEHDSRTDIDSPIHVHIVGIECDIGDGNGFHTVTSIRGSGFANVHTSPGAIKDL